MNICSFLLPTSKKNTQYLALDTSIPEGFPLLSLSINTLEVFFQSLSAFISTVPYTIF
jgi:hypothetical protein